MKKGKLKETLLLILFVYFVSPSLFATETQVVEGVVFLDHNGNGKMDGMDFGHPVIRVHLYKDNNQNRSLDLADEIIQTDTSRLSGKFKFILPEDTRNLFIGLEKEDLPTTKSMSRSNLSVANGDFFLGFHGESVNCVAIGDGSSPDKAVLINKLSGINILLGESTGVRYIEALAIAPISRTIFAVNREKLGKINRKSGDFEPLPDTLGTGSGAEGPHHFQDADGLTFNPFTGDLFATERREFKPDLLYRIDTTSGSIVKNAFGKGLDYLILSGEGTLAEIDDIAIHPVTGQMYGVNNFAQIVGYDLLVEINPHNGHVFPIDTIKFEGNYLNDVEGLGFDNAGQLQATTGSGSADEYKNALYTIDLETAEAFKITNLNGSSDFEACDCMTNAPNKISGRVFEDLDLSRSADSKEKGFANVKVFIYQKHRIEEVDEGPLTTLIDSVTTDTNGHFSWSTVSNMDFEIKLDEKGLVPGYSFLNPSTKLATFSKSVGGSHDSNNDFALLHDAFYEEWKSLLSKRPEISNEEEEPSFASAKLSSEMLGMRLSGESLPRKTMSLVAGPVVGLRMKYPSNSANMRGAEQKILETIFPSILGDHITSRLIAQLPWPSEIELKMPDWEPGIYYFQLFTQTKSKEIKVTIAH